MGRWAALVALLLTWPVPAFTPITAIMCGASLLSWSGIDGFGPEWFWLMLAGEVFWFWLAWRTLTSFLRHHRAGRSPPFPETPR